MNLKYPCKRCGQMIGVNPAGRASHAAKHAREDFARLNPQVGEVLRADDPYEPYSGMVTWTDYRTATCGLSTPHGPVRVVSASRLIREDTES